MDSAADQRILVTGACGFIGACLSLDLLRSGAEVVGADNLSRRGGGSRLEELSGFPRFHFEPLDLADRDGVERLLSQTGNLDAVFHLAGQVAVTRSYEDRRQDFESNLLGSFNLLEGIARHTPSAYCLYASTNKVYGRLQCAQPIGIEQPIDPWTPYGVSKAAAELYFSEYGRQPIGLATCSLRQSCIYGHHQLGTEDQGWLAWFAVANLLGLPIEIYGSGDQTRDLLYVDDLVALYRECLSRRLEGVYPVGGGSAQALSLRAALDLIPALTGRAFVRIDRGEERPGDQPYFVADLGWTEHAGLAWKPTTGVETGLRRMIDWLAAHRSLLERLHVPALAPPNVGAPESAAAAPLKDRLNQFLQDLAVPGEQIEAAVSPRGSSWVSRAGSWGGKSDGDVPDLESKY